MPFLMPFAIKAWAILFTLSLILPHVMSFLVLLTGFTSTNAMESGYILAFLASTSITVIIDASVLAKSKVI
jgi:hypothetical protein